MKRKRHPAAVPALFLAAGLFAGLVSCAPEPGAVAGGLAPAEQERLVIYTSHKEEVWLPVVREFEARTGIWAEVVSGGTNELLNRLEKEKEKPEADLMFGGGAEGLEACRDLFEPCVTSEVSFLDSRFTDENSVYTPFTALPQVLIYNTKLVDEGSITGWADLLDPEYRGQIAFADPDRSGSSFTGLMTMLTALGGERNTVLQAFAENVDGRELPGSGDVLTGVAQGTFRVGITLEETAMQKIAEGDNIALVYPEEGTSAVPDGCALVKGARHRDNAVRFLDFVMGKDVQEQVTKRFYRRPARTDVTASEDLPLLEEIKLLDYSIPEAAEVRQKVLMSWKFFCTPDVGGKEMP